MKHALSISAIAVAVMAIALTACGGGGSDGGDAPIPTTPPVTSAPAPGTPADTTPTDAQRTAAANATAQSDVNACAPVQPFYWEVGDRAQRKASGSVQAGGGTPTYTASTPLSIASASKWLYGAYVVQRRNAVLTDSDIKS